MWEQNITGLEDGIFRTRKGNSDELIAIGRCIKAGFACSKVEITNGRYDAVIEAGKGKLLRVQIKGSTKNSLSLTGGGRSGKQISREVKQRTYKYSSADCDLIIGVDGNNGDCYIIPIADAQKMGTAVSFKKLEKYKENWKLLEKLAGI